MLHTFHVQLFYSPPHSNEIHYDIIHYLFLVLSMLGFLFFDMLYVAVVINYCTQCQLLHYYVSSIKDKVVNKAYLLGDAVKVSYHIIREIVKYSSLEASNYYIFPPHH